MNGARAFGAGGVSRIPSLTDPKRIGASLANAQQQLLSCGRSLTGLVESAGQALVGEALARLGQQRYRIAVVGQIKSGKSSVINALAGKPHLLPTDVTPWTTTVTHLHFAEKKPATGAALFQFFSNEEWQDLATGDERIRKLTQSLEPGFEADLLRRHVEAMKQRAVMRLGSDFADLLGCTHAFESFETELLTRYVCSGDFAADSQVGQYADITKQADIYLDDGPFAFPVTLTDTPGTNDPFLIRDEITRRSLESADLYVVVLTARQPLSEADVNLMRLMHGLNSERVIVFVNRIDDFADVGYDLAEVLMYVEKKLKADFPGANIPIIAGSAAWANCALNADAESLQRVMGRPSFGYLSEIGLVQQHDVAPEALGDAAGRERLCGALMTASGLPTMYRALAEAMASSQAVRNQMQIARWFGEMANASAKAAGTELESVRAKETAAPDSKGDQLRETAVLNDVEANVETSAKSIQQNFASIIDQEMSALRKALMAVVTSHAATERDVLIATLEAGRAPRTWTLEGIALRRALASEFMERFNRATARVLEFQGRIAPELARLMSIIAPGLPMPAEPEKRLLLIPAPSMAALSRRVALDIDGSWWSSLWKGRTSAAAHGEQIEALIAAEFQPVAEDLVDTARRALSNYSALSSKWSFGLCVNIIQGVKRRRDQLVGSRDGTAAIVDSGEQAEALTARLQKCRILSHQLETIAHDLGTRLQRHTEVAA